MTHMYEACGALTRTQKLLKNAMFSFFPSSSFWSWACATWPLMNLQLENGSWLIVIQYEFIKGAHHGHGDRRGASKIPEKKFSVAYKTLLNPKNWKSAFHVKISWHGSLKMYIYYQIIWKDWRSFIVAMFSNTQYQEFLRPPLDFCWTSF